MEFWTVINKERFIKETSNEQVLVDLRGIMVWVEKRHYNQNQIDEFLSQICEYMFEYRSIYEETNWDWGITETSYGAIKNQDISTDDIIIENDRILGAIPSFITNCEGIKWGDINNKYNFCWKSIGGTARSIRSSEEYVEVKIVPKNKESDS